MSVHTLPHAVEVKNSSKYKTENSSVRFALADINPPVKTLIY